MKRGVLFALVFVLLAAMAFGAGGKDSSENVVKIGLFQALSGNNGPGGRQQNVGIEYAHSQQPTVDINGKSYRVELVVADNQSLTSVAPAAAQTLVSAGVSISLGSFGSGVSIAASDTFGAARVPAIGMTNTNPNVTLGNDHYFRLVYLDPFQGQVLASHAKTNLNAKTAYVLTQQGDDYSTGLSNFFMETFGRANVIQEFFPPGTSDFSSYVATARARNVDVFMSPTSPVDAQLIIDQINMQGLRIPILAGDTWDSNVIVEGARGKNVTLYVSTFYAEGASPQFDAGLKGYINANPLAKVNNGGNDLVAAATAVGYDAYFVALEAIKKAGSTDPSRVLEALRGVQREGVTGHIEFNQIGDRKMDFAFVKQLNPQAGRWENARKVFAQ
jgi:branched-chain amino acid transport system substrate-binding protein